MDLPIQAKYRDAKCGGKILQSPDGYEYSKSKDDGKRIHFFCRGRKKYDCKVTAAVTSHDNMIVRVSGEHNHDNDLMRKTANDKENEAVCSAARNPTVSPRTVLANLTSELRANNPQAVSSISKSKTFSKKIQRERKKLLACPEIPRTWQEMKVPDNLKKTSDHEDFLLAEETVNEETGEKVIGFASPTGLEVLDTADTWSGDETFEIAEATMFSQVFIILGRSLTGKSVSCCYFLLPNKQFETYKMMFKSLRDKDISPPRLFFCDFESAIIRAVREVFPEVEIYCCDAHFKRAVRTNLQKHHLQTVYETDRSFQTFVRYLWGLSLVPKEDIIKVWDEFVVHNIPEVEEGEWDVEEEQVNNFLDYFEKTWLGAMNNRTNMRRNPKFKHDLWSKFAAVVNGDDTTTNASEGFNSAIKISIPHNANIWCVMKQFQLEDSLVAVKLRDSAIGADSEIGRTRTTERQQRTKDLRNLMMNYHNIPLKDYMGYVVDYYNHNLVM